MTNGKISTDVFTTNRIAKNLEAKIREKAEKHGHEKIVRASVRKLLRETDGEMSRENTEAFVHAMGILCRAGYIAENDIIVMMNHFGLLTR